MGIDQGECEEAQAEGQENHVQHVGNPFKRLNRR